MLGNAVFCFTGFTGLLISDCPLEGCNHGIEAQEMADGTDITTKCSFFEKQSTQDGCAQEDEHIDRHTIWQTVGGESMYSNKQEDGIEGGDCPAGFEPSGCLARKTYPRSHGGNQLHRANHTPDSSEKYSGDSNEGPPIGPNQQV